MDTLTKAFSQLRKQGLIAKQNFSCCQGCGCCEISTQADEARAKGKEYKGYVFYHRQDNDNRKHKPYTFYLAYGQLGSEENHYGLPAKEVGQIVVKTLADYGVATEWDGDPNSRILVRGMTIREYREPLPKKVEPLPKKVEPLPKKVEPLFYSI